MDLSLLGSVLRSQNTRRGRATAAVAAVGGVAVLDALAARRLEGAGEPGYVRIEQSMTVIVRFEEVYLSPGDRVVVPFPIACGHCAQCEREMYSLCENSNPNDWMAEKLRGYSPCGIFGYSHLLGGYAGGQAEYARVGFADVGPLRIPDEVSDEQALFLSDILPTGYMAAEPATSSQATSSRSGGADRSVSSRSRARTCSGPRASSRSTASHIGSRWPATARAPSR